MKKIKLLNNTTKELIRLKMENALGEKGKALQEALVSMLENLEVDAEDITDESFVASITSLIEEKMKTAEPSEPVMNAITKAISERLKAVQNSVNPTLSVKVRNEICAAVLRANGKEAVEDEVRKVLVKNDITGLSFNETLDFTIVEKWGDLNPIFGKLHRTPITKFFYNNDTLSEAKILARQWSKSSATDKKFQEVATTGKTIDTKYIYKQQDVANEDMDEIRKAGQESYLLRWINEELDRQIVNTCTMAILIGDNVNGTDNERQSEKVTTFETIGTKTSTDAFTVVDTVAIPQQGTAADTVTLEHFRKLRDKLYNKGEKVMLVTSQAMLTQISAFVYASGGSVSYRSKDEIAGQLGVDYIETTDLLTPANDIYGIFITPDEYWVNEKNAMSVAYPKYERNKMCYLKERNMGGKIHGLLSTGVLRKAAANG